MLIMTPMRLWIPDLEYKTISKPVSKVEVNFTLILERIFRFDNEKFCWWIDPLGSITNLPNYLDQFPILLIEWKRYLNKFK